MEKEGLSSQFKKGPSKQTLLIVMVVVTIVVGAGAAVILTSSGSGSNGDVTVYVTETGSKYHRLGCQYLAHGSIPMTLRDAVSRGYTPCSVCHPPVYQP
ncbi:MAG: hypothetical protein HXY34_06860 [Candidatus Thorarchaeota archaeon]|nr:hypothetical protein [Candidatus Thorarchaeota archaeon]